MADVNKTLDPIYARLSLALTIDLDANVARHYRRDVPKLLSAVENVLALCDKALAVKVTGASEGDVAMAAMAAQVHKAITDALGATDE